MQELSKYIEIHIDAWNDLFLLNQSFFMNYVFRGQGNEAWELETSIRRMVVDYHTEAIPLSAPNSYEKLMLKDFKWKYPGYQDNPNMMPKDNEAIEWLSVMQHFGTKTRLLDFSDSLFVALYMALYGANKTDSAVWALNRNMIRAPFRKAIEDEGKHASDEDIDIIMYSKAEEWLNKETYNEEELIFKRLYIVRPRICNERISRQQGLFVIPSNISMRFQEIMKGYCDMENVMTCTIPEFAKLTNDSTFCNSCGLIKIIIPNKLRFDFTRALQQMNISAETMYPGLEGLAQSINSLRQLKYGKSEGNIINLR